MEHPTPHSDPEWIERLRNGDEAAFEELHTAYSRRVYAFALKRLRDPAEAEDVAQDVFLQLHRSIARYEGRSSLLTWIFGIAHHETCNRFRRRRIDTRPLDEEAAEVAGQESSQEERLDASRTLQRCAKTLREDLSPGQQRVFELRYWGAQSVESVAQETGKSTGAVRIGLLRTRRALLEACAEVEGEAAC